MSRTPLPVENPPKSLTIEPYSKQNRHWPSSGPTILAQFDDDTIVVYVETSKLVAAHAVKKQHGFHSEFEPLRVYTSFIRSQAQFEWNSKFDPLEKLKYQQEILRIRQQQEEELANRFKKKKKKRNRAKDDNDNGDNDDNADKDILNDYPQQRHTLAVRIRRSTFDQWIETASLEDSDDLLNAGDDFDVEGDYIGWRFGQMDSDSWQPWWFGRYHNDVVYRWVNDTYPVLPLNGVAPHQRLARKSLELFLFLSIEDITPFVNEIRARLTNHKQGNVKDIWSPSERPYIPSTDRILE
ncbi:hypothetical protein BCR42DRAFT_452856 [Absidia repens]|uniref:Uncharacterized protein n=1 Tax=Absidia repens TaxID=90262 RepID=A0A1X2IBN5_9FUNG|nr:hypothetical protein BCR42DRAFT_452856 [Absidia repens]